MDERTDELIQMELDGEISEAESAELDAALVADGEARASLESYRSLAREIERLARVDPPPLLATGVARAIRGRQAERAPRMAPPSPASRRRQWLFTGYAAAAGLILGLLATPLLMRTDAFRAASEPAGAAASIGSAELSSWEVVDRRSVSTANGTVALSVRRNRDRFAVEVAFAAPASAEAAISWDASRLSLLAFVRDHPAGPLSVGEGRVAARLDADDRLTLVLASRGAPGSIHVEVNGTRALSSDLSLERFRE